MGGGSQWGREFRALCDMHDPERDVTVIFPSQWGREFRALCDRSVRWSLVWRWGLSQWGREFRALCDLFLCVLSFWFFFVSQWGREFRALCDRGGGRLQRLCHIRLNGAANSARFVTRPSGGTTVHRLPSLNGAANSARFVTWSDTGRGHCSNHVSMGPRIPRAL